MEEQELYQLIKKYLVPDLYKFTDRYAELDCYSKEHDMFFELKCRSSFYSDLMIEKHKYDALKSKTKSRYINSVMLDGYPKVISFDIQQIPEPIWEWKMIPNANNEHFKGLELTEVGYFNIGLGKNITKKLIFKN
jgi:hypothetical protein